jgi:hypothetical protein
MAYPHAIIRDFSAGWDTTELPVSDTDDSFFQLQMPGYSRPFIIEGALYPQMRNLFVNYPGRLQVRAGLHKVTTSSLAAAPMGLTRYRNATLQKLLIAVDGTIIAYDEAAHTSATLSTGQSGSTPIDFAQFYDRVFWCDGSKAPQKWNGATGASQLMGIVAPTTPVTVAATAPTLAPQVAAPAAALQNIEIDPLTANAWTVDAASGSQSNRLPNWDFASTTGSLPTDYTGYGLTPDEGGSPPGGYAGNWVNMDTPGDGFYNTTAVANDTIAADSSRYANQVYAAINAVQQDHTSRSTIILHVYGYADSAGTELVGIQSKEFAIPFSGTQLATLEFAASFASYLTPILSWRFNCQCGAQNALGTNAIYVQGAVLFPFVPALTTSTDGARVEIREPQLLTYTGGFISTSGPGLLGYGKGVGNVHLSQDFTTSQNWSASDMVTLALSQAVGISGLALRVALRQSGSATRYYSDPMTFAADGSSASVDISTIPLSVRQSFRYVELCLNGDIVVPGSNGDTVFLFGPLTGPGNLGVNFNPYYYETAEVNDNSDPTLATVTESKASPASNSVAPTLTEAEASVSIGTSPANVSTTHYAVYRFGGVYNDQTPEGRLIAVFPIDSDVAMGADSRNASYSWDHATGIMIDNTPDASLTGSVFPASGALLSSANAGNLDNSFTDGLPYQYYATFVNGTSGVESNPSPISSALSIAGESAQISDIPISSDAQVTQRNLYRQGGTSDVPRFLATINDNATTTYTDNAVDTALALTELSFTHDPPLAAIGYFYSHKNRIIGAGDAANPYRLYLSSYGLPEYWPTVQNDLDIDGGWIDVEPTFGDAIVGFCSTGSLLVIAKADSIHVLMGDSFSDFVVRKAADYGCIARRSLARCQNQVIFLGPDGMVYALADDEPTPVALALEKTLKTLTRAELAEACATYSDQRYILIIPRASGTDPIAIAYDFRVKAWTDLSDAQLGATDAYASLGQETNAEVLLATKAGYLDSAGGAFNGVVSALGPADLGSGSIGIDWETPAFEFGRPTFTKRGKSLKLEGELSFSGAAPTATVTASTPGRPVVARTYPLAATSAGGKMLLANLDPALIGRQLSVEITGEVTTFELNTLDMAFVYLRERAD